MRYHVSFLLLPSIGIVFNTRAYSRKGHASEPIGNQLADNQWEISGPRSTTITSITQWRIRGLSADGLSKLANATENVKSPDYPWRNQGTRVAEARTIIRINNQAY